MADLDSSILKVDPRLPAQATEDAQTIQLNSQKLQSDALTLQDQRQESADQHTLNDISKTLDPSSPTYFSDLLNKSGSAGVSAKTLFQLKQNVNQAQAQDLNQQKAHLDIQDKVGALSDAQAARMRAGIADLGEDFGRLDLQWKGASAAQQKDPVFQGQMKTIRDNDIKQHLDVQAATTLQDMKSRGVQMPDNMTDDQKNAVISQAAKAGDTEAARYMAEVQHWTPVMKGKWDGSQIDSLSQTSTVIKDSLDRRLKTAQATEAEAKAPFAARDAAATIREKEANAKKAEAEAGAASDPDTIKLNAQLLMKDPTALSRMPAADRRAAMKYLAHDNITADDIVNGRAQAKAWGATVTAFDKGKQGDTTRSLNVAVSHLGVLEDAAKDLKNGDERTVNKFYNSLSKEFGKPEVTSFEFAKEIVSDEVVKAVIGGGAGGVSDREHLQAKFDAANSPSQLADVIKDAKRLMGGQLAGLRQQYVSAGTAAGQDEKKVTSEFNNKLSKNTRAQLPSDDDSSSGGGAKTVDFNDLK